MLKERLSVGQLAQASAQLRLASQLFNLTPVFIVGVQGEALGAGVVEEAPRVILAEEDREDVAYL